MCRIVDGKCLINFRVIGFCAGKKQAKTAGNDIRRLKTNFTDRKRPAAVFGQNRIAVNGVVEQGG